MQENIVKISELLNERFDTYFHSPHFANEIDRLNKSPFKLYPLGELCLKITDGTHYTPKYVDKGIKFVSVKNIRENSIDFDNTKYITPEEHFSLIKRCKPEIEDILLTKIGTIGNACVIPRNVPEFSIFVSVALLQPNKKLVNPYYLQLCLSANFAKIQMKRELKGIGVPDLHLENIKKIQIPTPETLEQQKEIVEIMKKAYENKQQKEKEAQELIDSIDDFILDQLGIKLPQVENKKDFTTSAKNLFASRFDTHYHQPKFKKVETSLNNSQYELIPISEFGEYIPGFAFSSSDYIEKSSTKLLTIKNIKKNSIDLSESTYFPDEYYEQYKKFQIKNNDIVFAMTGATIGKSCIFNSKGNVLLNQRVGVIRTNTENNSLFLNAYINLPIFQDEILRRSCGGAQPNISEKEITSIKIPRPDKNIQDRIAKEILQRIDKAKQLQQEAKEELDQAKTLVEKIILGEESL